MITASYKAMVPTHLVIGQSWRWHPKATTQQIKELVVQRAYADFGKSRVGSRYAECADYFYVRPLGIVIAAEGKNRVALFREMELPEIPALVDELDYPVPGRIKIFELGTECYAILDDEFVEQVHGVHIIRKLMEAYGVEFKTTWPTAYPSLERIRRAFTDGRVFCKYDSKPVVELASLYVDSAVDSTVVKVALMDVEGFSLPSTKRTLILGMLTVLAVIGMASGSNYPYVAGASSFFLGSVFLASVAPFLPLVGCRIDRLKQDAQSTYRHYVRRKISKRT
jgi:hypothetical protein